MCLCARYAHARVKVIGSVVHLRMYACSDYSLYVKGGSPVMCVRVCVCVCVCEHKWSV